MLLGALALNGCGPNWEAVNVAQPRTLDAGTVLEFRARNELVRLHGVQFAHDSLSGIPWLEHLTCDTCRVHYALADISQSRIGNPGAGAWNIVLPLVAVIALGTAIFGYECRGGRCGN